MNTVDFDSAVNSINKLLKKNKPNTFNSTWIREYAPHIYRFFQKNVRREIGGIDWDSITRALDRKFQRKWITSRRHGTKLYRNKTEVKIILRKYEENLYTFLTPEDKDNNSIRDIISIALVRIAQKGNVIAKREIIKLVSFTIDEWIENCPKISRWKGYEYLIQQRIEGCIRCYRYSGSFMGYLFRTLEYAGKGLRLITEYSLDEPLYSGQKKIIDRIAQDSETREILIGSRNIYAM
jgi:hypothetical protein